MAPSAPRAAEPTREIFDPFNSSATGHQRAENRLSGSTLWRESRHTKLRDQYGSGAGGGKRIADSVGAGSDGRVKMGLLENGTVTWRRENGQLSLHECLAVGKNKNDGHEEERKAKRIKLDEASPPVAKATPTMEEKKQDPIDPPSPSTYLSPIHPNTSTTPPQTRPTTSPSAKQTTPPPPKRNKALFTNLTIYINGSTSPQISDHKLKRLLTEHGANISISLGRRTVTHVILGRPGNAGSGGGGLAASKIQKEIGSRRGEKVKFVTVHWVLESIKAGKRLSETRFEAVRLAPQGVGSVRGMFARAGGGKDGDGVG